MTADDDILARMKKARQEGEAMYQGKGRSKDYVPVGFQNQGRNGVSLYIGSTSTPCDLACVWRLYHQAHQILYERFAGKMSQEAYDFYRSTGELMDP